MAHERQAIREKIIELLKAGPISVASESVYSNRTTPISEAKLPGIVLYSNNEDAEIQSREIRESSRIYTVVLEIQGAEISDESLEDKLDDIAKEIEDIFENDITLEGLVNDSILGRTIFNYSSEGAQSQGMLKMFYDLEYVI